MYCKELLTIPSFKSLRRKL